MVVPPATPGAFGRLVKLPTAPARLPACLPVPPARSKEWVRNVQKCFAAIDWEKAV